MSPNRIYNCAFAPIDDWRVFSEIMFLLLGGTGVGRISQALGPKVLAEAEALAPRVAAGKITNTPFIVHISCIFSRSNTV